MGDIVLSAGVRQNLLSLQSTAQLMASTQNRLATGKKVNSALDNPANFFTSQTLNYRASDLNALLDAIGQGQKILEAADKGLTSLTKLVESAKATARQAQQAAQPSSTYSAVNANSDISAVTALNGTETIGSLTGNNTSLTAANFDPIAIAKTATISTETLGTTGNGGTISVANSTVYSFDVNINGAGTQTVTYTSDSSATYAEILAGLQSSFATAATNSGVTAGTDIQLVANGASDGIKIDALQADVDFTIANNSGAGLTNATYNSTSLLDNIGSSGQTLSVTVNGGTAQTITFGNGAGQVSTIAELNTQLNLLTGGVSASAAAGAGGLSFSLAAGQTNTLTIATSNTGLRDALGLNTGRTAGQGGGLGTTPTDLSRTYNSAATLADSNPAALLNGGNLTITVNGSAQTVGLGPNDRLSDIITKLKANATLDNNLNFSTSNGDLKITAKTADVDFTVTDNNVSQAIGLTTGTNVTTNSTSLLDLLNTKLGGSSGQGSTLTVAVNGGSAQTITFGTGTGQVSTFAEFTSELTNLSGVTATLTGTALNIQVPAGSAQTSLAFGGTAITAFGLPTGTQTGTQSISSNSSVRANLQSDYNGILTQIDALVQDTSYNGINLLNGDNLKIIFNEDGSSNLTISGVTINATGLGLVAVAGTGFQDDTVIDGTLTKLDTALSTLRTQASKFGSNLTTVQIRQDFTKQLINTLQTGADNLVLADSNEEGANLLALQTRQQLSTTALSLSAQADQAVLRLFG